MDCPHERRRLGLVISRDGREQIEEHCLDCHCNARGPGIWIAREKVADPESLPVLRDLRTPEDRGEQRTLFA